MFKGSNTWKSFNQQASSSITRKHFYYQNIKLQAGRSDTWQLGQQYKMWACSKRDERGEKRGDGVCVCVCVCQ